MVFARLLLMKYSIFVRWMFLYFSECGILTNS